MNLLIFGCYGAGSTSGSFAARLLEQGHAVTVATRTLRDCHDSLRDKGCKLLQCDVQSAEQVKAAVDQSLEYMESIDGVLISAAAASWVDQTTQFDFDINDDTWLSTFHTNLLGAWHVIKHTSSALKHTQGNLVCISSRTALEARNISCFDYGTSKAALNQLVRLAAKHLAPEVKINAIAPGLIINSYNMDSWGPVRTLEKVQWYSSQCVLGRPVEMNDYHDLLWLLLTTNSMTGQIIQLDCGSNLS